MIRLRVVIQRLFEPIIPDISSGRLQESRNTFCIDIDAASCQVLDKYSVLSSSDQGVQPEVLGKIHLLQDEFQVCTIQDGHQKQLLEILSQLARCVTAIPT
jgi:hypothetical protein